MWQLRKISLKNPFHSIRITPLGLLGEAEDVATWYNQPGECSENWIRELKLNFNMERMPCGR